MGSIVLIALLLSATTVILAYFLRFLVDLGFFDVQSIWQVLQHLLIISVRLFPFGVAGIPSPVSLKCSA
jgi:hypothetical protein